MTQDKARKRAARQRAAETGESYTRAARALAERTRFAMPPAVTPPGGWPPFAAWWPAVVVVDRNLHGDRIEVVEVATGRILATTTVPHIPAEQMLAVYTAEGLFPPRQATSDAPITTAQHAEISIGRPDLTVYRLGHEVLGTLHWHRWTDGTWRTPARPACTKYSVTAAPLPGAEDLLRMVVEQHPGAGQVIELNLPTIDVPEHWQTVGGDPTLDAALNSVGYTVKSGLWYRLPGRSFYAQCRPGLLAERDWWTLAKVRITRETVVRAVDPPHTRTFKVGEIVTMNQRGRAGREVDRDVWWSSTDIDGAHIIGADCVAVVEVLENYPPTWAEAEMSVEQVTAMLAPHHAGAAEAAAAWASASLYVSIEHGDLVIRSPGLGRRIGQIGRDYWAGNTYSKPYEVIIKDAEDFYNRQTRRLDSLPLDPLAASRAES